MKLEISQKELAQALTVAQKAIVSKSPLQILTGFLWEAKNNTLSITGTDLELFIETKVPCRVMREGRIVINAMLIQNITRKLPDEMINIEVRDDVMHLSCLQASFTLQGQNAEEYPAVPVVSDAETLDLPIDVLKNGIRQTIFSTSQDLSRPVITGVLLEGVDHEIRLVSLDGYRVSYKKIPTENTVHHKIIIPHRTLMELDRIVTPEDEMKIQVTKAYILFDLGQTRVISRLIEGQYVEYAPIFRTQPLTVVTVNKDDLIESLERAALLSKEDKTNLVKLHIENGIIHISSNNEIGSVKDTVSCTNMIGDEILIAFNCRYLLEGLRVMEGDQIKMELVLSVNPIKIYAEEKNDYTYLVLPVRLAGDIDGYRD